MLTLHWTYWVHTSMKVKKWNLLYLFNLSASRPTHNTGRVKRIWYLSPMRAAKVQASLRIRAVSPEPLLLAHTSSESRGTFRQKASSLAPLNGSACTVKIYHDGMLENTNSLDGAHTVLFLNNILNSFLLFSAHFIAVVGQAQSSCWTGPEQLLDRPRAVVGQAQNNNISRILLGLTLL